RCFLASRRVEPLTFCGSVMGSGCLRGWRTLTVVPGASSPSRGASPERRRLRRRDEPLDSASSSSGSAGVPDPGGGGGGAWNSSEKGEAGADAVLASVLSASVLASVLSAAVASASAGAADAAPSGDPGVSTDPDGVSAGSLERSCFFFTIAGVLLGGGGRAGLRVLSCDPAERDANPSSGFAVSPRSAAVIRSRPLTAPVPSHGTERNWLSVWVRSRRGGSIHWPGMPGQAFVVSPIGGDCLDYRMRYRLRHFLIRGVARSSP